MTYIVEGKPRRVGGADGVVRMETAPTVELRTAAGLLRWALKNEVFAHRVGGVPYPKRFDDIHLGDRDHVAGHDYQLIDTHARYTITSDHLAAMRRARARYVGIVHYLREIEPQWQEEKTVPYMDNSVERTEVNKYGKRRKVTVTPPSGDVCF